MNILDNYQRSSHPLHLIRYHLRSLIYASSKTKFIAKISQTESIQKFFTTHPALIDLPIKRYLDNRWSVSQRYAALSVDFENAYQKFDCNLFDDIIQNTSIKLFDLGVYAIYLELNTVCLWEGFWALSIKDLSNKTIYNLSFAFLSNNTILIGSVQGIKVIDNNEYEQQRAVTKLTFGLRPPNLLITTLQTLCKPWGIVNLLGINPKFIGTKKYFRFANEFKFGYDNFWKELEGIETTQRYWQIPSLIPIKDLDQVSSNKRSKYRSRNLLLYRLHANCLELFPSKLSDSLASTGLNAIDRVKKLHSNIPPPRHTLDHTASQDHCEDPA